MRRFTEGNGEVQDIKPLCGVSSLALSKSSATVGASSLPQCHAEQDPDWKEENGTKQTQASEGIFQDANSARRAASHYHHRRSCCWLLDYGVSAGIGRLGRRNKSGARRVRVWRGLEGRLGSCLRSPRNSAIVLLPVVIAPRYRRAVGWGSVLQKGLAIHSLPATRGSITK